MMDQLNHEPKNFGSKQYQIKFKYKATIKYDYCCMREATSISANFEIFKIYHIFF